MGIFKDLHVYLVEDAIDNVDKVKGILRAEAVSLEYYCTDLVDLVVSDSAEGTRLLEEEEEGRALPAVVSSQWVLLSQKCGAPLPVEPFLVKNRGIFDGLTFSSAKLCRRDKDRLWSMVVLNGGHWRQRLDRTCTHLLTVDTNSSKCRWLEVHQDAAVCVLSPEWVLDCISSGRLLSPEDYHPSSLGLPSPPPPAADLFVDGPSSQTQVGRPGDGDECGVFTTTADQGSTAPDGSEQKGDVGMEGSGTQGPIAPDVPQSRGHSQLIMSNGGVVDQHKVTGETVATVSTSSAHSSVEPTVSEKQDLSSTTYPSHPGEGTSSKPTPPLGVNSNPSARQLDHGSSVKSDGRNDRVTEDAGKSSRDHPLGISLSSRHPIVRNQTAPTGLTKPANGPIAKDPPVSANLGKSVRDPASPVAAQEAQPNPALLKGMVFAITGYQQTMSQQIMEKWHEVILAHGGRVLKEYDGLRCTHLIAKHCRSRAFEQAMGDHKCIASAYWLNEVLTEREVFLPRSPLHFPVAFVNRPAQGLNDYCLCWTNYVDNDRQALKDTIKLAGFSFTGYLSKKTTHLICQHPAGAKFDSAKQWAIPVLNATFTTDVLYEGSIPDVHPYHRDLSLHDDLTPNHPYPLMILNLWKQFVRHRGDPSKKRSPPLLALSDRPPDTKRTRAATPPATPLRCSRKLHVEAVGSEQALNQRRVGSGGIGRLVVIFTGFTMSHLRQLVQVVESLGGSVVSAADQATHVVAQKISRTVKFLAGLCHCQYVLSGGWIEACSTAGRFVEEKAYILKDPENELLYEMNLSTSLERAKRRKIFEGLCVYSTSLVVPEYAPLKIIIQCAGGKLLTLAEVQSKYHLLLEGRAKMADMDQPLVIICRDEDFEVNAQEMEMFFRARIPMFTPEIVFTGILRQEYFFAQCRIIPPEQFTHRL